ncbi:hypothetical protein P4C99_15105 [Pontiellaceae bacterium B1224]|nr:hypothetical protein [Pontiellaceae bacterium B1224]
MKKLTLPQQKILKTVHLISVSLWLSNVVVLLFLPIISRKITSGDELYMYNVAYHFIDMFLLTPAAILTLITGLIYSLFTKWGFFKHGWLICKWIITTLIILTGTFYLGPMVTNLLEIADLKRIGALQDPYYLNGTSIGLYAAIINTVLLTIAVVVSVYKPWKNIKTGEH